METLTLTLNGRRIPVATIDEASRIVLARYAGKGARAFYRRPAFDADGNGALVRDGQMIGHISFNGRAWAGVETFKGGAEPLA